MRFARCLTALFCAALAVSAADEAKKKNVDGPGGSHCSPPVPGAPSLPAVLMAGKGTEYIDFPITTSNP